MTIKSLSKKAKLDTEISDFKLRQLTRKKNSINMFCSWKKLFEVVYFIYMSQNLLIAKYFVSKQMNATVKVSSLGNSQSHSSKKSVTDVFMTTKLHAPSAWVFTKVTAMYIYYIYTLIYIYIYIFIYIIYTYIYIYIHIYIHITYIYTYKYIYIYTDLSPISNSI